MINRIYLLGAAAAVAIVTAAACKDTNVPFYTAPTSVPNSPAGVQNAVSGLFAGSRLDVGGYMTDMDGFGRNGANYTNTEPRLVTYELGVAAIDPAWAATWANSYGVILQSHQVLSTLPTVVPAYTAQQLAALTGIVQTIEALNYMVIAEDHDSVGLVIMPQTTSGGIIPGTCVRDGWKYIVALLDSANANLNTGGAVSLSAFIKLPTGFGAVSNIAGPSTVAGSFAAFNRALAGKAGLELAYAIARGPGGTRPTPTDPGQPDQAALTRADSAFTASALYSPANLTTNPTGGWVQDGYSVFHDFSAQSGDQINPMNRNIGTIALLNTIVADQDTVKDLRWKAKIGKNPNGVQQQTYNFVTIGDRYNMYQSPSSPIPIVRNEKLVLQRAQVLIGLTQYAAAAALIDQVHTTVGGLPSELGSINTTDYVSVRDFLLREQQISTLFEASGERAISIRMYKLEAQLDTTWKNAPASVASNGDLHTTVDPIPFAEISARGGSFAISCP